jgi:hypothetical protein
VDYLTFNDMELLKYMCETMDIQWKYKGMLILYNDNSLIVKNDSINNADPIFVCKTPEENAKSKTLPRTSKLILNCNLFCFNAFRFACLLIESYAYKL